jgi:1-acyl-sn-glycerol-3-phosphate acyltransferase
MLGATGAGLLLSPVLVPALAVRDLWSRRASLPSVRVALFLLQYGVNDSVEILLAPLLWLRAGFGRRLTSATSIARHARLQRWSIEVLARRAERLLGLRIDIDAATETALAPGPVIVLCRHVSVVDSSLPALLYHRLGFRTRGVLMAELLADPGFDLIYPNTGSVFIPRDNGPDATASIRRLAAGADDRTALIIYPEGRLFRPERLQRDRQRLAERNPERAGRLEPLRYLLPPRPGGVLALLDTTEADVVIMAHTGLDRFASFAEMARAVPLSEPITVAAWRVARTDIPADPIDRIAWLDRQWLTADGWVADRVGPSDRRAETGQ